MNIKIATTIEQSKKLLDLGLDTSTADMYYKYVVPKSGMMSRVPDVGEPTNALMWYNIGYTLSGRNEPLELKDFCIPCWSFTALFGLMPNGYSLGKRAGKYYVCFTRIKQENITEYTNPLDAAFEMVIQLIEQGHIKVNK